MSSSSATTSSETADVPPATTTWVSSSPKDSITRFVDSGRASVRVSSSGRPSA